MEFGLVECNDCLFAGGVPDIAQSTGKLHSKSWSGGIRGLKVRQMGVINFKEHALGGRGVGVEELP